MIFPANHQPLLSGNEFMNLSNNLKKIREYAKNHTELLKSHHFLFNCPLSKDFKYSDAIVIGLNPGESPRDWDYGKNLPTEESHEFDFHDEFGKGRSSVRWSKYCKDYLNTDKVTLSEFFFWSSAQVGEDPLKGETFSERFGYKFKNCPHFNFCKEQNIDLINFHNPKVIIATGTTYSDYFAKIYNLKHIETLNCENDSRNRRVIVHYEFNDTPFLFTPHWSAGFVSNEEEMFIKNFISRIK